MPRVPAHLCGRALGMLQGGMRTADVARAINCNVRTVRRLRQRYRETGRTADRPQWQTTCNNTCTGSVHHRCETGTGWQQLPSYTSRGCLTRVDGRIRIYRRRNESYTEACILEQDRFGGGGSVMVWGGVQHRTELVVIAGVLNDVRYREDILLPHVVPFLQAHPDMTL
uniref:Uncharacterized protein n=1 Tax=Oncorhynchus tshawytscha TaxID=74940 RepID=A0AAZ3PSG8_ONCTS